MKAFEDVTVVRAANIYFDGKVTSRTIEFANGEKKSLGIMQPGDYRFETAQKELMEIQSGEIEFRNAGESEWQTVRGGGAFEVLAESYFDIKVHQVTDYCCSYLD